MNSNQKYIFDSLVKEGYNVGDEATFSKNISTPDGAKWAYDTLKELDYNLGDMGSYMQNIINIPYKQEPVSNKSVISFDNISGLNTGLRPIESMTDEQTDQILSGSVPGMSYIGDMKINHLGADMALNEAFGGKFNDTSIKDGDAVKTVNDKLPRVNIPTSKFSDNYTPIEKSGLLGSYYHKFNAGTSNIGASLSGFMEDVSRDMNEIVPLFGYYEFTADVFKGIKDWFKSAEAYSKAKSNMYNGEDFISLAKKGKYLDAANEMFLTATESLPVSLSVMLSMAAGQPILGFELMYANSYQNKADELKGNEDMSQLSKTINAAMTGLSAAATEYLGSIPFVKWADSFVARYGTDQLKNIVKGSLKETSGQFFKKYGIALQPVIGGVEEFADQVANNFTNYITGETKKLDFYDLFEGAGKSFAYGMAGGMQFSAGMAVAEGTQKFKVNKEFKEADKKFTEFLSANGYTPEEVTEIKNDLLSSEKKDAFMQLNSLVGTSYEGLDNSAFKDYLMDLGAKYISYGQVINKDNQDIKNLIEQKKQQATEYLSGQVNQTTGTIMTGQIGPDEFQITKGNIVTKEDGTIDYDNSDKQFYYIDDNGVVQVAATNLMNKVTSIPYEEAVQMATDKATAPVIAQQENEYTRPYNPGEQVRVKAGNGFMFGTIVSNDNGVYILKEKQTGQEVQIEPRMIVDEDNLKGMKNGMEVQYTLDGETKTGTINDMNSQRHNGRIEIDNEFVPVENIMPLQQPENATNTPKGTDKTQQNQPEAQQNVNKAPEYPLTKDGEIDFEKMTDEQTFQYVRETEGEESANREINNEVTRVQKQISENIRAVNEHTDKTNKLLANAKSIQESMAVKQKQNAAKKTLEEQRVQLDERLTKLKSMLPQVEKPDVGVLPAKGTKTRPEIAALQAKEQQTAEQPVQEVNLPNTENVPQDISTPPVEVSTPLPGQTAPVNDVSTPAKQSNPQKRDQEWGDVNSMNELILRSIIGGQKIRWSNITSDSGAVVSKGLGAEYRFSPAEMKQRIGLIAKDAPTPEQLAHNLWEQFSSENGGQFDMDTQEILSEILDIYNTHKSTSSMILAVEEMKFTPDEYAYYQNEIDEYEKQRLLENIPDDVYASILGITNFTPEQIQLLNNILDSWGDQIINYGTDTTTEEGSTGTSTQELQNSEDKTSEENRQKTEVIRSFESKYAVKPAIVANSNQELYDAIKEAGASEVHLTSLENAQRKSLKGVYYKGNVFINVDEHTTEEEVLLTLIHEHAHAANSQVNISAEEIGRDLIDTILSSDYDHLTETGRADEAIVSVFEAMLKKNTLDEILQGKSTVSIPDTILPYINNIINYYGRQSNNQSVNGTTRRGTDANENRNNQTGTQSVQPADEKLSGGNVTEQEDRTSQSGGGSTQVTYKNGDVVYYNGKQYTISAVYKNQNDLYDITDENGNEIEEVSGVELSTLDKSIEQQNPNTDPTEAQKIAGNYKKAHITVQGMDITVENPKGSTRSGVDEDGQAWSHEMNSHYGYFKRTNGKDGDHIDVFVGPDEASTTVYVVDQVKPKKAQPKPKYEEDYESNSNYTVIGYADSIVNNKLNKVTSNITEDTVFAIIKDNNTNQIKLVVANSAKSRVRKNPDFVDGVERKNLSSDNKINTIPGTLRQVDGMYEITEKPIVYFGENKTINSVDTIPEFDESKVMIGYNSPEQAKQAYMENYDDNWQGFSAITPVSVDEFKKWLYDGARQAKPFSEYVGTPDPVEVNDMTEPTNSDVNKIIDLLKDKDVNPILNLYSKDVVYRGSDNVETDPKESTGNEHFTFGISTANTEKYAKFHGDNVKKYYPIKGNVVDYMDLIAMYEQEKGVEFETEKEITDFGLSKGYVATSLYDNLAGLDTRYFSSTFLLDSENTLESIAKQYLKAKSNSGINDNLVAEVEKILQSEKQVKTENKTNTEYIPLEGWEDNLMKAREYALNLGIDFNGKSKEELVQTINEKINPSNDTYKSITRDEFKYMAVVYGIKPAYRGRYFSNANINDKLEQIKQSLYKKGLAMFNGGFTTKGRELFIEIRGAGVSPFSNYTPAEFEKYFVKYWNNNQQPAEVDVKGLFNSLYTKGQAKLSDNVKVNQAKPVEEEVKEQPKQEPAYGENNKVVTKDRYEELKQRMKNKLNNLNMGFDPELFSIGAEMSAYHIESGARKFVDFAKRMIEDLGDTVRPYLKAFYSGARYFPGIDNTQMDGDNFVNEFDLNTLNNDTFEQNNQDETDNQAETGKTEETIEVKAGNVRDKAKNAKSRKQAARVVDSMQSLFDEIEQEITQIQLELSAYSTENIEHENPNIVVAKTIKKDVDVYLKALASELGWNTETDKKGKTVLSNANIAPAGGDVTFHLYDPNSNKSLYVSLSYSPEYNRSYDDYRLDKIMWRLSTTDDKYGLGSSNNYEDISINTKDFAAKILKLAGNVKSKINAENSEQITTNEHYIINKQPLKSQENGTTTEQGSISGNPERLSQGEQTESVRQDEEGGRTSIRSGKEGGQVYETSGTEQSTGSGNGSVLSGNDGVLNPPVQKFEAEDNDKESFNALKKYDDNIAALETLIKLISEKRKANPEEKSALAKYVGFGGLKDIQLNPEIAEGWTDTNEKYRSKVKRIIQLAQQFDNLTGTKGSMDSITGSILNAHFTPSSLIRSIYDGIAQLGFKSGSIVEPSAGSGNFITFMPNNVRSKSNITAVEIDNLTGNILKYIHDDVYVKVSGIQEANIPDNSQDLVISNVPFGNYKIFDKNFKGDKVQYMNRIHNYFFVKGVDMAREGGIIAFITSKGVLDSNGNENVRQYLNENTEFLGAVRLPNNAFKNSSNTEVVTDVIFLRKNTSSPKNNPDFVSTKEIEVTHKDGEKVNVSVNSYFLDNPKNMAGEIIAGGLYSRSEYTIKANESVDYTQLIKNALPSNVYAKSSGVGTNYDVKTSDNVKEGNITVIDDQILVKENGLLVPAKLSQTETPAKVNAYMKVRNTLMDLIESEYRGASEEAIKSLREDLNKNYNTFVSKYGKLAKSALKITKIDADGYNVLSLEKNDGSKADIFSKRTIQPLTVKQSAQDIDEAILISLYENASIDIERIAELLGMSVTEAMNEAKGKLFELPEGGFQTRDEYLSGNVKKKLKLAKQASAKGYSNFDINISELENVIPKDIPALNIEARLGSRWIPEDVYTEFAQYLFNDNSISYNYVKSTDSYAPNSSASTTVEATKKWGTERLNGVKILTNAMHIDPPKVYDTLRDGSRVLNVDQTQKAKEKYDEIRAEFENWVYKTDVRRNNLSQIYNEKFNTSVKRTYNGNHLNIPGINNVSLYDHQKDAIWMLLQNNGGIIDHIVGAGKTYVMIAATMEMKRTGIAKKPMILALKSTIPQIVTSYRDAYPMAKILAPTEKDFTKENRKKLFSQIANNEWDVIIMSHDNYGKIPHEQELLQGMIQEELDELFEEREKIKSTGNKNALKGIELRIKNLEARLERISDMSKDNSLTFEQMGIDHIMVDESQMFKNLAYVTQQTQVAGLSKPEGSKRAFNLYVGIRYLQGKYGADKGTTFLSGTPISNSMVEMYLLLKYLRPNKMNEMGINSFDSWATTFASPSTDIEFTVTGNFKQKTRFREFINVPELSALYTEIADIRTDENLVLDKPKMKGNGYTMQLIKMNDEQEDYAKKLIKFAETKDGSHIGIPNMTENQKTAAMLIATNLSSKMAIDMRLINPGYSYDPNGKVATLVNNVVRTFNETNEYKGTQLIFSDLGTPKNKNSKVSLLRDYMEDELGTNADTLNEIFGDPNQAGYKAPLIASVKQKLSDILELTNDEIDSILYESENSTGGFVLYDEIKYRLIEAGIPEEQIVYIHDYNTQKAKTDLFEKVNEGKVRIVLGSTQKLGTGVNVQTKIAAIHHVDVPWTPASMEQRNGRGIRQGNFVAKNYLGNELPVYAYATEKTLDAYKYQLLETKQRFLDQVKSGNVESRTIMDSDGDGESGSGYAEFVAALSGNKDILTRAKLEQKIRLMQKSKKNYLADYYDAQENINRINDRIPIVHENIAKTKENIAFFELITKYDDKGKIIIDSYEDENLTKKDKDKTLPYERTDYAGKAIEDLSAKLMSLPAYKRSTLKLGEYTIEYFKSLELVNNNGKQVEIEKTNIAVKSSNDVNYSFTFSSTPGILLNNLQKAIENLPSILTQQEQVIERNKRDLVALNEILQKGETWEKEEELQQAQKEFKEVSDRLNAEAKKNEQKVPEPVAIEEEINEDSPLYRIIGEIGASRKSGAEKILDNLALAKQMEYYGYTKKNIRQATGWEKGVDEKWRYEQPDNIELKNMDADMLTELIGKDHELFVEYPELKEVQIAALSADEEESEGIYFSSQFEDKPTIFAVSNSMEGLKSVLIHEIQHAIQDAEGFATGANGNQGLGSFNSEVSDVLIRGINEKTSNPIWKLTELDAIISTFYDVDQAVKDEAIKIARSDKKNIKKYIDDSPYGKYRRTAGEVEARNVQKRMNMTDAQRRNTLLSETEDVERQQQIVLFDAVQSAYKEDRSGNYIGDGTFHADYLFRVTNKEQTTLYHGGSIKSLDDIDGPFYAATDKKQAIEYAKGNDGSIQSFSINSNDIYDEEVVIDEIKQLGLKPGNNDLNFDELTMYELIDPKFNSAISEEDLNTLIESLDKKGVKAVRFTDMNLKSLKQDIQNIVVFDKSILNEVNKHDFISSNGLTGEIGTDPNIEVIKNKAQDKYPNSEITVKPKLWMSGQEVDYEIFVDGKKAGSKSQDIEFPYIIYVRDNMNPYSITNSIHLLDSNGDFISDTYEGVIEAYNKYGADKNGKLIVTKERYDQNGDPIYDEEPLFRVNKKNSESVIIENTPYEKESYTGKPQEFKEGILYESSAGIDTNTTNSKIQQEGSYTAIVSGDEVTFEKNYERLMSKWNGATFMGDKLTGRAKITSSEDVAFLFKNLEHSSTENVFAVFISKSGAYKVLWVSHGATNASVIDNKLIYAAAMEFKAKKVTFVHNHPSGNLRSSKEDVRVLIKMKEMFSDTNVEVMDGIVINLDSGKYLEFDEYGNYPTNMDYSEKKGDKKNIPVYQFDRHKLYVPSNSMTKISSSYDIATYLSKMKRGTTPKIGALILDGQNRISRYMLFDETISIEELTNQLKHEVAKHGQAVALHSNKPISTDKNAYISNSLRGMGAQLLDIVIIKQDKDIINNYKSYADEGKLLEPEAEYSKTNVNKAPNGKKSKLNKQDWNLVRTEEFKSWFGDWENNPEQASKVLDENGEPLVVYHGTLKYGFDKFKSNKNGIFFSDKQDVARGYSYSHNGGWLTSNDNPQTYSVFVKSVNPMVIDAMGKKYNNIPVPGKEWKPVVFGRMPKDAVSVSDMAVEANKQGYDGLIVKNVIDSVYNDNYTKSTVVSVFESEQIKIKNHEEPLFRITDNLAPNGKKSNLTPEQWKQVRTPEFKSWFGDWETDPENSSKVVDENGEPKALYHGTGIDFDTFRIQDSDIFGTRLGHFFTEDKNIARIFAERNDIPLVKDVFLNIRNPKSIKGNFLDNLNEFKGADAKLRKLSPKENKGSVELPDFRTFRNQIISEGNDGIVMNNISIKGDKTRIVKSKQYVAFDSNQIKSATENNGQFNPQDDRINFRITDTREIIEPEDYTEKIRNEVDDKLQNVWSKFLEGHVNEIRPVEVLFRRLRANGVVISENDDYVMKYTLKPGIDDEQITQFRNNFFKPLLKTFHEIEKAGYSYEDIKAYAILKHGPEYDEHIRNKEVEIWKAVRGINEENIEEYQEQIEEFRNSLREDYSGRKVVEKRIGKSGEEFIAEFETKIGEPKVKKLWSQIKAATSYSLEKSHDAGIISTDTYENVSSMFEYYIPLRGHREETAEKKYEYQYENGEWFSKPLQTAKGRKSESEDPFAYIFSMALSSIVQANNNILKQNLLRLAHKNTHGTMSANRQWIKLLKDAEGNIVGKQVAEEPEFNEDVKIYRENIEKFENEMLKLKEKGEAYQSGDKRLNIGGLFIKPQNEKQHEVTVYRNGQLYTIRFHTNPAVPRAINGTNQARYDGTSWGTFLNEVGKVTRFMSATKTMFRPTFVFFTNPARDFHQAVNMSFVDEGAKFTAHVLKHLPMAVWSIVKYNTNKLDTSNKYDKYMLDYMMNGGKTGITEILEIQNIKKRVERDIKRLGIKHPVYLPGKGADAFVEIWKKLSFITENQMRLAVYMAAKEKGYSDVKSARMAKDATIDFNKKGSGQYGNKELKSLFAFINVGYQAINNFYSKVKANPKRGSAVIMANAAAGYFLLSNMNAMLSLLIDGDDDSWLEEYANLSEYTRNSSLCIYLGKQNGFATIPLSQELRVPFALGSNFLMFMKGKITAAEMAASTLKGVTALLPYNPIESIANGTPAGAAPDIISPALEIAANKNFMGYQIYNGWKSDMKPGFIDIKTNRVGDPYAPEILIKWMDGMNSATGGDNVKKGRVSLDPDKVDHLMNGYLGGLYKMFINTANMVAKDDKNVSELIIPKAAFIRSKEINNRNTGLNQDYYEIKKSIDEMEYLIKGYQSEVNENRMSMDEFNLKVKDLLPSENQKIVFALIKAIEKAEKAMKDEPDKDKQQLMNKKIIEAKKRAIELSK